VTAPGRSVVRDRRERRRQRVYGSYRDGASDRVFRRDMAEVTEGFEPAAGEGLTAVRGGAVNSRESSASGHTRGARGSARRTAGDQGRRHAASLPTLRLVRAWAASADGSWSVRAAMVWSRRARTRRRVWVSPEGAVGTRLLRSTRSKNREAKSMAWLICPARARTRTRSSRSWVKDRRRLDPPEQGSSHSCELQGRTRRGGRAR